MNVYGGASQWLHRKCKEYLLLSNGTGGIRHENSTVFLSQQPKSSCSSAVFTQFDLLWSLTVSILLKYCHLKYYLHSHRCPKFLPCFRAFVFPFVTLFCHTSEFYHKRPPGGARQNPRSGFFLVLYICY